MIATVLAHWRRAELFAACALLSALVALVTLQMALRAFGAPLKWAEEAGAYIFIWMIFMGAAAAHKQFQHIRISLSDAASPAVRRAFLRFANLVVAAVCLVFVLRAQEAISLEWNSKTTSLPIDLPRAWFYSVPLTYMAASTFVTSVWFAVAGFEPPVPEEEIRS